MLSFSVVIKKGCECLFIVAKDITYVLSCPARLNPDFEQGVQLSNK